MTAKKSPDAIALDPRSAALVLSYVGDERPMAGIPARDLSENDVCRIVHERAMAAYEPLVEGSVRPDPLTPDQAAVRALVDELLALGVFTIYEAPPDPPAEAATPADTMEG